MVLLVAIEALRTSFKLPTDMPPLDLVNYLSMNMGIPTDLPTQAQVTQLLELVFGTAEPKLPTETAAAGPSVKAAAALAPATCTEQTAANGKRKAVAQAPPPSTGHNKTKAQKLSEAAAGTQLLAEMFGPDCRTKIRASELKAQRAAAAHGEDYEPEVDEMRRFRGEGAAPKPEVAKIFACAYCPKQFSAPIALLNHERTHDDNVRPKIFFQAPPPKKVTCCLEVGSHVVLTLRVGGLTGEERLEKAAKLAAAEHTARRQKETYRRFQLREAEIAVGKVEHRSGSRVRQSYTASQKLKILDWYDEVKGDEKKRPMVKVFEGGHRAQGAPYTTVLKWADPVERRRIAVEAASDHSKSLLRIDNKSRHVGKYAEMEKQLKIKIKERRVKGRKVSPIWVTAMAKQLMRQLHPDKEASFKAGQSWRKRFLKRAHLARRKKTNCKNKSWEDAEPVLLRYFATLRKRLQGGVGDSGEGPHFNQVEPEPEDINPVREAEDSDIDDGGEDVDAMMLDEEEEDMPDGDLDEVHPKEPPAGFQFASSPPLAEQLAFSKDASAADELVDQKVLFNWGSVGWLDGTITRHGRTMHYRS
jgi:hypothetical protein